MNTRCRSSANLRGETQCRRSGFIDSADAANRCALTSPEMSLDNLINQIKFIEILSAAKDLADFSQRILALLKPLGFSDFAIARRLPCGTVELPFCSLPSEFAEIYRDENFSKYDMVLDYLDGGSLEPIYLSLIRRIVQDASLSTLTLRKNQALLLLYQKFGVEDAYLIPVDHVREEEATRTVVSIMCKGCRCDEFQPVVERSKSALQLLAKIITCVEQTKFSQREAKESMICQQSLRLLWVIAENDLSLIKAAEMLRISVNKANKQMARARKELGAISQANAVYQAVKQGLIPV